MKQNKLYIANLPFNADVDTITAEFSKFGDIEAIALIPDRHTGELKGFGFITFQTQQAAENALTMNGVLFGGRNLKVSWAVAQTKKVTRKKW